MARIIENKACNACGKAKRRCGKQTPHCLRCRTRGIECKYPPSRPTQFVEILSTEEDTPLSVIEAEFSARGTKQLDTSFPTLGDTTLSSTLEIFGIPKTVDPFEADELASSWFSSKSTWLICFPPASSAPPLSTTDVYHFIDHIRRWLRQWVDTGTNPFIHARLYKTRLPRCIQDAYATLTCYVNKTAANERMVLRVVEDRAAGLVEDHRTIEGSLDALEQISKVQALLIYQIIGLYDGDIRLRHLAESHIPILNKWMQDMVQLASDQTTCLGSLVISPTGPTSVAPCETQNLLWYAWILAESIRRTWVVGSGAQVVYLALQGSGPMPCQGGMMFSTRKEVWEAPSAMAWEKLCSEVHVGLMQMADAERLFGEVEEGSVNEFTKVALELCFGRERMERWGVTVDD
ncbi:uncharacterized protein PAC_03561 [Phialocephala subalpina]|uniref:Zn(2)-C6 fungal-type domain-containing protein n=1 Tax=Phialocephala subalpina TaxID=576137 RepID=A0A1L7WLL9_9HELO|nr:uncharacterized protein PAC_03561 [Phialocephala subalpina]